MQANHESIVARGPQVLVRYPSLADETAFLAMVRASRSLHRPWTTPPSDPSAFRRWVERRGDDFEPLVVVLRQPGDANPLVGVFNLSQIVLGLFQSAYLGYYANVAHEGCGLMSEGLALTLRHAFGAVGLHRVEANIQPGNVASKRLVERAGFVCEGYSERYLKVGGVWRDHERWALIRENWRRRVSRQSRVDSRQSTVDS